MKVALAQFLYESNTFNPREATTELFTHGGTWLTDPDAVRQWLRHSDSQLGGSCEVLERAGCRTVPVAVIMAGTPAGRLGAECYQTIRQTLRDRLRAALPAEAILLHLHGAVCAVGEDDVEGDLLAMVRKELGFRGRLVVSLDLHANVTHRMVQHADAITAYRTFPHRDFAATGARAARLVLDGRPTVRTLVKIPALIPPTVTHDAHGHFQTMLAHARALEQTPGVLDVSLFPVQPWLDIEDVGTSVVVTCTDSSQGQRVARELATAWWQQRGAWQPDLLDWTAIIAQLHRPSGPISHHPEHAVGGPTSASAAARAEAGPPLVRKSAEYGGTSPWFLVDTADATTGGAAGTSAEAVAQLWPHRHDLPGDVLLWVVDPAAVAAAQSGATHFQLGQQHFPIEAEIGFTGECRYRARGSAYTGQEFSSGAAAVLHSGRLRIAVTTQGALCADPAFYECLGLKPAAALAIHVKSLLGWQAGYGIAADRGLPFNGPGCTSLDFVRLPFTGARRELFPFTDPTPNSLTPWQST
ncbi:MAG: M81 family metallopeptidase [Opitutaceae bacterium]|nr:M81 family metallopeptidase [Opitutaceae bacterium]